MENRKWAKQAWTIAKIELRRAFLSKRAFWVYALALFPTIIFFIYGIHAKYQRADLSSRALTTPALIDSVREGETAESVLQRLGKTSQDSQWPSGFQFQMGSAEGSTGITTHNIEPSQKARFIRLHILFPPYNHDHTARIYEFEVYGDGPNNLALNRPATGSPPCSADQGPEKAFNGSVSGGISDRWCAIGPDLFLQVDLGKEFPLRRVVVQHASAGGEPEEFNTRIFDIQASSDNKKFTTLAAVRGPQPTADFTPYCRLTYFDGNRIASFEFMDGKLASRDIHPLLNFEEDRRIFAWVFQFIYLRLAIFFGCLGIFMNLFRGEMLDKTLHFWFLVPARREVLLAGKYGAGLIASTVIFVGGTLLCFGVLLWTHNSIEVQAYWQSSGMAHAFWYAAAALFGCLGYGSIFLAAGLLMRNPIVPAAVMLGWESINGFLPNLLQKASVLYYLQSLCPVPAPMDKDIDPFLRLLLAPAAPVSRMGAILGLLAVTALVLWIARKAILRMQVNYSTET
jgi:hypothetical protein